MLSVLRKFYQRNARLSTNYFVTSSVENHFRTWTHKKFLVQDKVDCGHLQHLKLQKCNFRTTQRLFIPPIMTLLLRPIITIGGALMGRSIKKWWRRKSKEEKEKYKQWYRENRNVFLGCFGLYGLLLFIYYITHIEIDPLTQRSKFIIFNKKEKDLLNAFYDDMSNIIQQVTFKDKILPRDHVTYKRILRVFEKLITTNIDLKLMREIKWKLIVVDTEQSNSFTLSNGHIFIASAMLKYMENDDQLGFILAHEMAHSLLAHGLEMLSNQLLFDFIIAIPILLIWTIFPDMAAAVVHLIADWILGVTHEMPYKRIQEKEADEVAMQLSAKACFDVREVVVFWATLRTLTEMNVMPSHIPWLCSHPSHGDREKNMNNAMTKALEIRKNAGCPALSAIDPRIKFYERSANEQMIRFKQRGIITEESKVP